mgnify:CR=1 FL=1
MAYQKLQVGVGLKVVPSATINIPNASGPTESGTDTAGDANKLTDSTASFTNNLVGYIVYNTNDNTVATVTAVDSATVLSLSADIMDSGEAYTLYADDNAGCVLYIGNAGSADTFNVRVLTSSGSDITFTALQPGSFIPVQVKRVISAAAAGSGIADILALW